MMNAAHELRELGRNLYRAWLPEFIRVFRDIQPELWREIDHNPIEFPERPADQTVEDKYRDPRMANRLTRAFRTRQSYLEAGDTLNQAQPAPRPRSVSPVI